MAGLLPVGWLNGSLVEAENMKLSAASHSLHYGVGIFDGVMAYWNDDHYHLHFVDAHLARFVSSCERLGLLLTWSEPEIESSIRQLLSAAPRGNYYVRPLAFRAGPQIPLTGPLDHVAADLAIVAVSVPRGVETPLACHVSSIERVSGAAIPVAWKICAAYANSYLVRRSAELAGFDDALMLDRHGHICEASAANVFFLRGKELITPALTPDIFPGITRKFLIDTALRLGWPVVEREVSPSELGGFGGSFLASTLMEMRPLRAIGDIEYNSSGHQIFRDLLQEFRRATQR